MLGGYVSAIAEEKPNRIPLGFECELGLFVIITSIVLAPVTKPVVRLNTVPPNPPAAIFVRTPFK